MNVELTRWKRFGHDRLYVTVDDRKVGYRDLTTGKDHPEGSDDAALLTALVDAHLGESEQTPPDLETKPPVAHTLPSGVVMLPESVAVAMPVVEPPPTLAVDETWTDLATKSPGQAAREQAEEEWQVRWEERPVRAVLGRLLNVHTDERAWRIGADGEEAVGAQLEKLERKDPRWRVLHAVPVGERGSDIDHLVIGPAGVFTINTKHHPGAKIWVGKDQLRVDGHVQPYIRNSRFEAKRAGKLLTGACGFDVHPDALIVLFGVEGITVKTEPGEKDGSTVHVKYRRQAIRWLTNQPTVLANEQIAKIYEQARRSTTWGS